jgi:hypothetical protein
LLFLPPLHRQPREPRCLVPAYYQLSYSPSPFVIRGIRALANFQLRALANFQLRALANFQLRALANFQLRALANFQLRALATPEQL